MKKLMVGMMTLFLLGVWANSAQATLYTGCITPGGDIKNVAEGEEPSKPCGRNDSLIQWDEPDPEPVSDCPCDVAVISNWAGWSGPGCFVNVATAEEYSVQVHSTDNEVTPQVFLIRHGSDDNICTTISDVGIVDNEFQVSDEDFAACERDANQLAIFLGRIEGCVKEP